jgi:hypothetical protein
MPERKRAMIESPLINEIVAERTQNNIVEVLRARFDEVPEGIIERLRKITADKKLTTLIKYAVQCPSLESFRKRLT